MKNNLLKFFLLLNGVLSILATCPSYPTIPTTSIPSSDPIVLTPASEGMVSLDPSLTKLSISMTVTLDEECPSSGLNFHRATPLSDSEQSVMEVYINCDTFDLKANGYWFGGTVASQIFTGSSRTVNIFASIDLESRKFLVEANSADAWNIRSWDNSLRLLKSERVLAGGEPVSSFDETTKLYLCSSYLDSGKSALACTISRLQLVPTHPDDNYYPGYLGDFTPVTQAFYPLIDGELSSLIKSSDSAYFGDSASSPTADSSPSWDSSKSFVQISSETQFLTLPIPSVTENSFFIPTITFAFWTRVTSIPQDSATLFSVILEDGTTGFSFVVSQDTLKISGISGEGSGMEMGGKPQITLNAWQLISCSLYSPPGAESIFLTLSVGDSKTTAGTMNFGLAPTKLQIGDSTTSFIGDISSARILSSGAGYLTDGDTCSPNNAIQINSGPYAISCAEGFSFNPSDNKCYSSCPAKTETITPFTDAPYTLCLPNVEEEEEPEKPSGSITVEESSSGLSGGAIAGIAVGSVAGVALVASAGYYLIKIKSAKSVAQWTPKSKTVDAETPRKGIVTSSNIATPTGVEEIPLK